MFCSNCGNKLDDNAKFCPNCGSPVGTVTQGNQTSNATTEEAAAPTIPNYPMEVNGVMINAAEVAYNTRLFEKTGLLKTSDTVDELTKLTGISSWKGTSVALEMYNNNQLREVVKQYRLGHAVTVNVSVNEDDGQLRCPKCHSNQIEIDKQGFSAGKALVGGILTGGIGLVAGFHGKNKRKGKCLHCGHTWNI